MTSPNEADAKEIDCGDNSCIFTVNRGGMRTNGGCRCFENAGFGRSQMTAMKAILPEILMLRKERDALKAEVLEFEISNDSLASQLSQTQEDLKAAKESNRQAAKAISIMWDHGCHVANCRTRTKDLRNSFCLGHRLALEFKDALRESDKRGGEEVSDVEI